MVSVLLITFCDAVAEISLALSGFNKSFQAGKWFSR